MEDEIQIVVRDSNGTQLADGDTVMVVKDLKVRGSSDVLKRGTLYRNIKLTDDPAEIESGSGRSTLVLKTAFVKKA